MAVQPATLLASSAIIASGNGAAVPVATATMATVYIDVTLVGTPPSGQVGFFLRGSPNGTDWWDLPCDMALADAHLDRAQQNWDADGRNVNGDTIVSATGKWVGTYKHLPSAFVMLAWVVSGSGFDDDNNFLTVCYADFK